MAEVFGYARVSRKEQDPGAQEAELRAAGCRRVFVDHGESSRIADRPEWRKLDRLAVSERLMIEVLSELNDRGLNIVSLTEPAIDTTTPMGKALYGLVVVFAQLRVDTIRENTRLGLEHARSQGRVGGRPTVMTAERIAAAEKMRAENQSYAHIGRVLGVGASSVMRALTK